MWPLLLGSLQVEFGCSGTVQGMCGRGEGSTNDAKALSSRVVEYWLRV